MDPLCKITAMGPERNSFNVSFFQVLVQSFEALHILPAGFLTIDYRSFKHDGVIDYLNIRINISPGQMKNKPAPVYFCAG
jgi:hypothetical protein